VNKDGTASPICQRFVIHAAIQQDGLAINEHNLRLHVTCAGTVRDRIGMLKNMGQRWEAEDLARLYWGYFESRAHFRGCHPALGDHSSKLPGPSVFKLLEWAQARSPLANWVLEWKELAAKDMVAFHVDSFRDVTLELGQQLGEKEKQYLRAMRYVALHGDFVHLRIAMAGYSLLGGVDDSCILPRYERSNCDGVLSIAVLGNSWLCMTVLRENGATWDECRRWAIKWDNV
jgi:hypothetical protein